MSEGVYAEAGGMRFPDTHRIINEYIDIFHLSTVSFSNMKESQNGILYFDGISELRVYLTNGENVLNLSDY